MLRTLFPVLYALGLLAGASRVFLPRCKFDEHILRSEQQLLRQLDLADYVFTGKVASEVRPADGTNATVAFRVHIKRFFKNRNEDLKNNHEVRVRKTLHDGEGVKCRQVLRPRYTAIFVGRKPPQPQEADVHLTIAPVPVTLANLDRVSAATKGLLKMEEGKMCSMCLGDLDKDIIKDKPWFQFLLKMAVEVTKKGVFNWSNVMNKIGDTDTIMKEHVDKFIKQLEGLHEDMVFDADILHEKMRDKITPLLQELEKQCFDLHIDMPEVQYEDVSLCDLYSSLKKKYSEYATMVKIRRSELEELTIKQTELYKVLGRNPEYLPTSPLPSKNKIDQLQTHLEELECLRMDREERFLHIRDEILHIMTQKLKTTPETEFEAQILSLTSTQVMITDCNMKQLDLLHNRVIKKYQDVKDELLELRLKVDHLWNKLEIDIGERDAFCAKHRGNSIETLNAFKLEKERCDNLKMANILISIEKHREELVALWEACHRIKQEEIQKFGLFNFSYFNEDLLELFKLETEKWSNYYKENSELLKMLEEYKALIQQWNELEDQQSSANRYKNRGGQLLAEEKRKNTIKHRLSKVEKKLLDLAEAYLNRNGVPFFTFGETIPVYIENLTEQYKRDKKFKLSAKKLERDQQMFGGSNLLSPLPSSSRAGTPSPLNSATKPKITSPQTENSKTPKTTLNAGKGSASAAPPTLSISRVRRLAKQKRRQSRNKSMKSPSTRK